MNKKISTTVLVTSIALAETLMFFGAKADMSFRVYKSEALGIAFAYPKSYFVTERELGNGERYHHQVAIYEDTQENRDVLAGKSPGREGPVSITLDLYQNNLDKLSLETWIKTTSDSNFKLSDGTLAPDIIARSPALAYSYSGLYENRAVAFQKGSSVGLLSVSFINPSDQILKDFVYIKQSLVFAGSE